MNFELCNEFGNFGTKFGILWKKFCEIDCNRNNSQDIGKQCSKNLALSILLNKLYNWKHVVSTVVFNVAPRLLANAIVCDNKVALIVTSFIKYVLFQFSVRDGGVGGRGRGGTQDLFCFYNKGAKSFVLALL